MLAAMRGGRPDCVPVAPDTSNMIPCRLTGKPFWDIYLYSNPPLWMAYIDCARHFGFDGWLPDAPVIFDYEAEAWARGPQWKEAIVTRTDDRIITRHHALVDGAERWSGHCNVYYIDNPPTHGMPIEMIGLKGDPEKWEDVHRVISYKGAEGYRQAVERMGENGVVGMAVGLPGLNVKDFDSMYEYYDEHDKVVRRCEEQRGHIVRRLREIVKLKPDFVLIGVSGHMISNPEPIFRELSLPTLKDATRICREAGVVSQIHCCGPEYDLVKMSAMESDLDNINPLEIPPMGDCDLARIKCEFGRDISLMGNLHTTEVMLRGTPKIVEDACKRAIDDAAEGGGFILSTGDQCGRDTPDANIHKMVEVARTYGRY